MFCKEKTDLVVMVMQGNSRGDDASSVTERMRMGRDQLVELQKNAVALHLGCLYWSKCHLVFCGRRFRQQMLVYLITWHKGMRSTLLPRSDQHKRHAGLCTLPSLHPSNVASPQKGWQNDHRPESR